MGANHNTTIQSFLVDDSDDYDFDNATATGIVSEKGNTKSP